MVKQNLVIALALAIGSLGSADQSATGKCTFVPENNLRIPAFIEGQGVTQKEFNAVIDRVESIYTSVVSKQGGILAVKRLWENDTVNAQAYRDGQTWYVDMFGGLARYRSMTKDGFTLVLCHELGHQIGGAPKIGTRWASNEGQADYYAGLKCLRQVFALDDNVKLMRAKTNIDPTLAKECAQSYQSAQDIAICTRIGYAGFSVATMFQELKKEQKIPRFDTPDKNVVVRTDHRHPATQCRLDTYVQGAICTVAVSDEVSDNDPNVGTCGEKYFTRGTRPRCWYSATSQDLYEDMSDEIYDTEIYK
ncbi:MAG: hypothetical protein SGJ18_09775 [Pseudomonadota bacterium]|nr:hypothetical protein [Pseudomonadota bacterium]